jgi:hypothetical protein
MTEHVDTERILGAFLAPEHDQLPDRVLEASLTHIARTPQRRALRVPWRFPTMPALSRSTGVAVVALVAAIGAGGLLYLSSKTPIGPGGTPTPSATQSGTATAAPSLPGPTWSQYTSRIYDVPMDFPDGWSITPATRQWAAGDSLTADTWPWADALVSPGPGDASIGLLVWEMPEGDGFDIETPRGLASWAEHQCAAFGRTSCDGFTRDAKQLCLATTYFQDRCGAAILVPTATAQYAFFPDTSSFLFGPDMVRVVVVGREDGFPAAAPFGGAVGLLQTFLRSMDVVPTEERPTSPPGTPTSRIAYASDGEIYSIQPNGFGREQLTHAGGASQPSWSADGQSIAYVVGDTDAQIWVLAADGSDQRQLTHTTFRTAHPSWSPDGSTIAFADADHGRLYVISSDGSGLRQLTSGPGDAEPAWAPSGSVIAFANGGAIYTVKPDGSDRAVFVAHIDPTMGLSAPAWSPLTWPDGLHIVAQGAGGIELLTVRADGSFSGMPISIDGPDAPRWPAWSPDAQWIAFSATTPLGGIDLYVVRTNGTDLLNLTTDPAVDGQPTWR